MTSDPTTHPTRTARRRLLQGTAVALALAPLGAFAQGQAPARTLRIGHQKGYLSLLRGRGTLEKRLAPLGVAVKWTEFTAGPVQLEALNVGSIDFGDVGEAPPIFAQAAGAPLAYVAATVHRPAAEAVLVPANSALRTVADLKGRKIAFNKGSNVHYFLVKLLEKHGLAYGDVTPVFLPPADARAAFERGAVDAWVIWDPFLASAQHAIGARVLADARGVVGNRAYYFSSQDYARRHTDVLRGVVEEIEGVERWATSNRDAFATELATLWGTPKPAVDIAVARWQFGTVPVTRAILAEQQAIADTFLALKLIPRRIDVLDAAAPGLAA
jgi:sulfonate transport system substrate-binding protein